MLESRFETEIEVLACLFWIMLILFQYYFSVIVNNLGERQTWISRCVTRQAQWTLQVLQSTISLPPIRSSWFEPIPLVSPQIKKREAGVATAFERGCISFQKCIKEPY